MTENSNKNSHLLLGCIADDITGATDLGLMLASNGMPTTLFLGVPAASQTITTPAVVIALKIRTVSAADAVAEAGKAADFLQANGARQLFYKYCSTFDSTARGNIGPVTDALLEKTDSKLTVLLPAFPANGRTVKDGQLLVDGIPLAESSMRDHPLTPMKESSIPSLMDAQTRPGGTAIIDRHIVADGSKAVTEALQLCTSVKKNYACIDAATSSDLDVIAAAIVDLPLVTGGSGIGAALPAVLRSRGLLTSRPVTTQLPKLGGNAVVLAGSCSQTTREQIALFKGCAQEIIIDPIALGSGEVDQQSLAALAVAAARQGDVIVYSSSDPAELKKIQGQLGIAESAALVENTIAFIAQQLARAGIVKFVVAGGETSGAVADSLAIKELQIADEIDPGVPWMVSGSDMPLCLAFKSGNFGRPDFFRHAIGMLP